MISWAIGLCWVVGQPGEHHRLALDVGEGRQDLGQIVARSGVLRGPLGHVDPAWNVERHEALGHAIAGGGSAAPEHAFQYG